MIVFIIILIYCFIVAPVTSLTLTPKQLTVNAGEKLNLTCSTGLCNPAATIRWYKNGSDITSQSDIRNENKTGEDNFIISSSVLQYTGVPRDNLAAIFCTATNIGGSNISSKVQKLDVKCTYFFLFAFVMALRLGL